MNEKQEINILDIIKAYKDKDFEYLNTIGEFDSEMPSLDVKDDINVYYQFPEHIIKNILKEGDYVIKGGFTRINNITDIYFPEDKIAPTISEMLYGDNDILFYFDDKKIKENGSIEFYGLNYSYNEEPVHDIFCQFFFDDYFKIDDRGNIADGFLEDSCR